MIIVDNNNNSDNNHDRSLELLPPNLEDVLLASNASANASANASDAANASGGAVSDWRTAAPLLRLQIRGFGISTPFKQDAAIEAVPVVSGVRPRGLPWHTLLILLIGLVALGN